MTAWTARNGGAEWQHENLGYNFASQVLAETNSGGTLSSWWVTNSYDALMRRNECPGQSRSDRERRFDYGYDNASRLQSVERCTNNANLRICANLTAGEPGLRSNRTTTTRLSVNKLYDYLNRLSSISSCLPGPPP